MKEQTPCAISWCIALATPGTAYCAPHQSPTARAMAPPSVSKELQRRYDAETAGAQDVPAK